MRIFVYEHITGGGCSGVELDRSLSHEGALMARALVHDLREYGAVEVHTTHDARLNGPPGIESRAIASPQQWARVFREQALKADFIWPIAPETDGTLAGLSEHILALGRPLLGSHPSAVRVAGSKRACALALARVGLPVVPHFESPALAPSDCPTFVIKPDDGAGCVNTYRLDKLSASRWWQEAGGPRWICQPYLEGRALSLSVVWNGRQLRVLSCNEQIIRCAGEKLHFEGVRAGVQDARPYEEIAGLVLQAIPGLWGYFGIDLIQTHEAVFITEVNPRLTTAYVSLGSERTLSVAALVLEGVSSRVCSTQREVAHG
ncbi:MAG: ATP-grasp domain-containing protein [Burkholderiaceae bacterium]|jgi:predicted ATP-grasp superfamily ATP-dependent carboligase